MESEQKNWWHRLLDRFKGPRRGGGADLPAVGADGLLVEPADMEPEDKGPAGLTRWAKRESALAQLQEGYERVNQLMADMQQHMADQSARTERMCAAVEQLARTMEDLPALSREQARTLETIAGQMEASSSHNQQLAEAVGEIPRVTRAQADALAGISSRLEMMNEQNVVATQSMDKLNSAVASAGQTGQVQTELLKQLDARSGEHNRRLADLLAGQNRRFTILLVIAILVALAAVAAAVLAILRH